MNQTFVAIGAIIYVLGSFVYFRDTLKGDTKPNKISWALWALISFVATAIGLLEGVGWAVLPVFMSGLGPAIILFVSFKNKNAYWKLGTLDWTCGILSLISLVVWIITRDGILALSLIIFTDVLASFPTLVKSWKYPETESGIAYLAWVINAATAFFAANNYDFVNLAFPTYIVVMDGLLFIAAYRKKFNL
ncbi:hypothetical protein H6775_03285 [Candidatus Nomurabacteria bacterium]|nr:hypothetical protein [Candidatus Nomurabacteria bacterium]